MRLKTLLGILSIELTWVSCSTPPLVERYEELDGESKAAFLTYYPDLTPAEREEMLEIALSSKNQLRTWKLAGDTSSDPIYFFSTILTKKKRYTLTELKIISDSPFPIQKGTSAKLKAVVTYADGRSVDVTKDSQWEVLPTQASIKESTVHFGCLSSDIAVSVNFLNERRATQTVPIRKKIKNLTMTLKEISQSVENDAYIQFRLEAQCEDGTQTDVSCQANWSTQSQLGEMLGCGNFHVLNHKLHAGQKATFIANYGETSVSKTVELPERR